MLLWNLTYGECYKKWEEQFSNSYILELPIVSFSTWTVMYINSNGYLLKCLKIEEKYTNLLIILFCFKIFLRYCYSMLHAEKLQYISHNIRLKQVAKKKKKNYQFRFHLRLLCGNNNSSVWTYRFSFSDTWPSWKIDDDSSVWAEFSFYRNFFDHRKKFLLAPCLWVGRRQELILDYISKIYWKNSSGH